MKKIFIVVRPDMNVDVYLGGVFSNFDAAKECATDPEAEYEGYIWSIDLTNVKDEYVSDFIDDIDDKEE